MTYLFVNVILEYYWLWNIDYYYYKIENSNLKIIYFERIMFL